MARFDAFISNFRKDGIQSTKYFLLVDLDNPDGYFKHDSASSEEGVRLLGVHGTLINADIRSKWEASIGTVLDITGSDATIGWIQAGVVKLRDTGAIQGTTTVVVPPLDMRLHVENNDYKYITTNFKETVTDLDSSTLVESAGGQNSLVEIGDLILKVEKITANANVLAHYMTWYTVE